MRWAAAASVDASNMDERLTILRQAALFDGLSPAELDSVAALCAEQTFRSGEIITTQGEHGDELFVVGQGFVEVALTDSGGGESRTVVQLGPGQIVGEMSLVDRGPRSATVRALTDGATLLGLRRHAFLELCESNPHLGYLVMRNIAADLSFKLRHRLLTGR